METKNSQKTPDLAQNSKSTDSKTPQVKTDSEKALEAAQDATKATEDEISPEAKNTPAEPRNVVNGEMLTNAPPAANTEPITEVSVTKADFEENTPSGADIVQKITDLTNAGVFKENAPMWEDVSKPAWQRGSEQEITLGIGDIVKYNLTGEESRKYEKATGSRVDAIIIAVESEDEEDFQEAKLDLQVFPDGYVDSEEDDDSQISFIVRTVKCEEAFSEKTTLTWGVLEKSIFE